MYSSNFVLIEYPQSLDDGTLKVLGRDHSANDSVMLLKSALDVFGSDAVSVDLLFRKPGDTIQSWKNELNEILSYKPHHISLYELTPERGTPLFRQVSNKMNYLITNQSYNLFRYFSAPIRNSGATK